MNIRQLFMKTLEKLLKYKTMNEDMQAKLTHL